MGLETVRVAFTKDTGPTALVDNVMVRVFDTVGNLVTHDESGAPDIGTAQFELEGSAEGTEYQLRCFYAGARIRPHRILVFSPPSLAPSSSNDFIVPVQVFTLPVAVDPKMCRASGYLLGPARLPRKNIVLTFMPRFDAFVDELSTSTPGRFTTRTNEEGFALIDLYRLGIYDVTIEGREAITRTVHVPNRANILLPHLLFPVVVAVGYDQPAPFTVQEGETLLLEPTVVASDYRKLDAGFEDALYQSMDPTVANVQPLEDRIAIRGIKPGTTRLRVSRLDRSIVYVPDLGIEGGDVALTVTPRP